MGKWEKLNQRLDEVLTSMTQEDWVKWDAAREQKNEQRKKQLIIDSILHAHRNSSQWRYMVGEYRQSEEEANQFALLTEPDCYWPPPTNKYLSIKNDPISSGHFFYYNRTMNPESNTAFSFEGYKMTSFSFKIPPKDERENIDVEFSPSGLFIKADSRYILQFDFFAGSHDENGEARNIITATLHATFKFNDSIEFENIPDYFFTNCIAIIFPYLRAFVSTLTILGNIQMQMLPLYNLSHLREPLKEKTTIIDSLEE